MAGKGLNPWGSNPFKPEESLGEDWRKHERAFESDPPPFPKRETTSSDFTSTAEGLVKLLSGRDAAERQSILKSALSTMKGSEIKALVGNEGVMAQIVWPQGKDMEEINKIRASKGKGPLPSTPYAK